MHPLYLKEPSVSETPDSTAPTELPFEAAGVRSWAADCYASGAFVQAQATAAARGVVAPVALMPDAHVGLGACIGSVVATEGTIIPAAAGVDLGCGMSAARLECTADQLPDKLAGVLDAFAAAVPARAFDRSRAGAKSRAEALRWLTDNPSPSGAADMARAASQVGTLGSGNHFLEASTGTDGRVWVVVHSGSRGVGNYLARIHIRVAEALDPGAPRDLAALVEGTPEFAAYVADMDWAQRYAYVNREAMLEAAVEALGVAADLPVEARTVAERIRCRHNYAQLEEHDERQLWITRKGAISAREGQLGIVPGSMGTSTFIVSGLGNPASLFSAAHGAGRQMSRRRARAELDQAEFTEAMSGKIWLSDRAGDLLDEAPAAYKPIGEVMAAQASLCTPLEELTAVVNYKGC